MEGAYKLDLFWHAYQACVRIHGEKLMQAIQSPNSPARNRPNPVR